MAAYCRGLSGGYHVTIVASKMEDVMIVDSEKMKAARDRKALTQEALAHQARVNVRTIQRAENGSPIRHETVADIAAVLGMPVAGLIGKAKLAEPAVAEGAWEMPMQVLKRVESGEAVIADLERSVMSSLACSAEPTPDNMPVLRSAVKLLESLQRSPWSETSSSPLSFASLLDRLEAVANLNACLSELEGAGLALYVATSTERVRVPWMTDMGLRSFDDDPPYYRRALRMQIAEYNADRIRLPSWVRWPLETVATDDDDEVPF